MTSSYIMDSKDPQFTQTVVPLVRHEKDYPETL